jgi:hypothetical protein
MLIIFKFKELRLIDIRKYKLKDLVYDCSATISILEERTIRGQE